MDRRSSQDTACLTETTPTTGQRSAFVWYDKENNKVIGNSGHWNSVTVFMITISQNSKECSVTFKP